MHDVAIAHPAHPNALRRLLCASQAARCRVLLPFDGSEAARHALRYVAEGAGEAAEVHVVNVQRPFLPDPAFSAAGLAIVDSHLREGEELLDEARETLDAAGIVASSEVAYGDPVETIARLAEDRACALVVMGTRARMPLAGLVGGSVAIRVARTSAVPVLLVRHPKNDRGLRMPRYIVPPIGA